MIGTKDGILEMRTSGVHGRQAGLLWSFSIGFTTASAKGAKRRSKKEGKKTIASRHTGIAQKTKS